MHHIDAKKMPREKNAISYIEQSPEATTHETTAERPPTSITKTFQVSDVLLWISIYGRSSAGRPAKTYLKQF